jgi:hypothetical protein
MCIVVIDAEKIDQSWSTYTSVSKVQNVDIGRDHQGEAAGQRSTRTRQCAARGAHRPAQRTGGDRACARAVQQRHSGKKTASAKAPTTATNAAAPARPRGRSRTTTAKPAGGKRTSPTLGEQVLALATGKTQQEITAACKGARPNHIGVVISRHKRAGRIEQRDGKLYATQSTGTEQGAAL